MITLQHTLVTLMGLRGNERELDEEIQYVLLPDAIRRYCGPRQYSHFEQSYDGKDTSWLRYPLNLKQINKEEVDRLPKHIVETIKPCVLGEKTSTSTFEKHNTHLPPRYFAGAKKHLIQDCIFDEFIREKIDCSQMYEDKFIFNGQEYDGKGIRKVIADIENQGMYVLAYMINKSYGITTNQEWFNKHVKQRLDQEYSQELSDGTYKFMTIPQEINERITNNDWTHLDEGPILYSDYLRMYGNVVQEMPKVDYERKVAEERAAEGKNTYEIVDAEENHKEQADD